MGVYAVGNCERRGRVLEGRERWQWKFKELDSWLWSCSFCFHQFPVEKWLECGNTCPVSRLRIVISSHSSQDRRRHSPGPTRKVRITHSQFANGYNIDQLDNILR